MSSSLRASSFPNHQQKKSVMLVDTTWSKLKTNKPENKEKCTKTGTSNGERRPDTRKDYRRLNKTENKQKYH